MTIVTSSNPQSWLETIWYALHMARENCIPESDPDYDNQWNNICEAMAWLTESLGLELDDHGDYIEIETPYGEDLCRNGKSIAECECC
jgi:hypothetical protein